MKPMVLLVMVMVFCIGYVLDMIANDLYGEVMIYGGSLLMLVGVGGSIWALVSKG